MGTAIIVIILLLLCVYAGYSYRKNCAMAVAAAENMMPWKQK